VYNKAFNAFRSNLPLFFIFAIGLTLLEEFASRGTRIGGGLLLSGIVAFYCHRMVLLGESYGWEHTVKNTTPDGAKIKIGPFLWRFLLICLSLIVLAVASFITFGVKNEQQVMLIILIALLPFGLLLALLGTMLPAAATNGDASLSAAFRRGKKQFWKTLWRLLYGNVLFAIVTLFLLLLAANAVPDTFAFSLGVSFFGSLISCVITLLAATALCMAYEEAEA